MFNTTIPPNPVPVISTKELAIRESLIPEPLTLRAHKEKLVQVTRSRALQDRLEEEFIRARFVQFGFSLFVKPSIFKHFKYHAGFRVGDRKSCVVRGDKLLYYDGDIPDFALDRISRAISALSHKSVSLSALTVHSNEPFPMHYTRLSDPVVLMWSGLWQLRKSWSRWCLYTYDPVVAAVVAIWNEEGKEI